MKCDFVFKWHDHRLQVGGSACSLNYRPVVPILPPYEAWRVDSSLEQLEKSHCFPIKFTNRARGRLAKLDHWWASLLHQRDETRTRHALIGWWWWWLSENVLSGTVLQYPRRTAHHHYQGRVYCRYRHTTHDQTDEIILDDDESTYRSWDWGQSANYSLHSLELCVPGRIQ